jgi:hypothetical protein
LTKNACNVWYWPAIWRQVIYDYIICNCTIIQEYISFVVTSAYDIIIKAFLLNLAVRYLHETSNMYNPKMVENLLSGVHVFVVTFHFQAINIKKIMPILFESKHIKSFESLWWHLLPSWRCGNTRGHLVFWKVKKATINEESDPFWPLISPQKCPSITTDANFESNSKLFFYWSRWLVFKIFGIGFSR